MVPTKVNLFSNSEDSQVEDAEEFEFGFMKDSTAIDANFDYENFPNQPVEVQVQSLPKIFIDELQMQELETFSSHAH